MNVLSLFSGIGGLDLAAEMAGMHTVAFCEIDPFCRRVLAKHWPNVRCYQDVRDITAARLREDGIGCNLPAGSEEEGMAGKLKKLTPGQAVECTRMYEAGLSLQPIAEYFGVSRQAMWDLLRRRTTMRPKRREGEDNPFYRGGETADEQAHNLVETAMEQGVLTRRVACEVCGEGGTFKDGRSAVQAHHDDYNKPLEVRWLCQKCHHAWHKNNTAVRKEVQRGLPTIDVICGGFP